MCKNVSEKRLILIRYKIVFVYMENKLEYLNIKNSLLSIKLFYKQFILIYKLEIKQHILTSSTQTFM